MFEFELGTSFYRRSEEVAVNGITPARNYGEAEVGRGFRWLGIIVVDHWHRFSAQTSVGLA